MLKTLLMIAVLGATATAALATPVDDAEKTFIVNKHCSRFLASDGNDDGLTYSYSNDLVAVLKAGEANGIDTISAIKHLEESCRKA